jgi:hypothetical protein
LQKNASHRNYNPKQIFMRILLVVWIILPAILQAQVQTQPKGYDQIKKEGLPSHPLENVTITDSIPGIWSVNKDQGGFFIPLDDSFTLTMVENDDDSFGPFQLGFSFCFYGNNYNQVFINNNGNLSFGSPYYEFSPVGFPSSEFTMIAPFWGDVDTRAQPTPETGTGMVWHKLESNPKRLIVIWDHVGYYSEHTDKLNTFQVIITDGNDPLIGIGNNVAFAYGEMEWTTGDASEGVDGFGGYPATVGVNKGDGTNFALVGRFDKPGTCYDGPYGNHDCVGFLNNLRFVFDACDEEVVITPDLPEVITADPTGITTGSAIVGGEVFSDEELPVTQRGIYWGTDSSPATSGTQVPAGNGIGTFSLTLESLSGGTLYYVVAYANNITGRGFGEVKPFTTKPVQPVVTTSQPLGITSSTAVVGGHVITDGGAPVTQRGVLYGTDPNPVVYGTQLPLGTDIGTFSDEVKDLERYTWYYVVAYAVNSEGTSYGSVLSFQTLPDLPEVLTAEPVDIETHSAVIGGQVLSDGDATVTNRGVAWSTDNDPIAHGTKTDLGSGTGTFSTNLNDLVPGDQYFVAAYATNSQGTTWGEIKTFTTKTLTSRIPNAFMPSSHIYANQTFKPAFNIPPLDYSMTIYNNWGGKVFHSNEPSLGWDGSVYGGDAPAGGYVYRITYTNYQGEVFEYNGIVMLIR